MNPGKFPTKYTGVFKDYGNFINEANKEFTVSVVLHTVFLWKLFIYSFRLYYFLTIMCLKSHLAKDHKYTVSVLQIALEVGEQTSPSYFVSPTVNTIRMHPMLVIHYRILLYQCHGFCCFSDSAFGDKHWHNFSCCCRILLFSKIMNTKDHASILVPWSYSQSLSHERGVLSLHCAVP